MGQIDGLHPEPYSQAEGGDKQLEAAFLGLIIVPLDVGMEFVVIHRGDLGVRSASPHPCH